MMLGLFGVVVLVKELLFMVGGVVGWVGDCMVLVWWWVCGVCVGIDIIVY